MKKILFSLIVLIFFANLSFAACPIDCENKCETKQNTCTKCQTEDDEYYVYNQCWFDKHYRKMKIALCLSQKQENCIDNIYKNFKSDMENQHARYTKEKNKLLEIIECNRDCFKEQRKNLKYIARETKEKCQDFHDEIKQQLCKDQIKKFNKFKKCERKKFKKLIKYGKIVKLPCVDCCKKTY